MKRLRLRCDAGLIASPISRHLLSLAVFWRLALPTIYHLGIWPQESMVMAGRLKTKNGIRRTVRGQTWPSYTMP
ncbi:hypothetical protein BDP55DRAFT_31216 [Colletotrichum godetiae]|uniref:Uncharacterized protein n=1 Tax=Colletotrichum godetiae TaxID=1209918 RepID=A0AAJ0F0S8_9PEZI|nr:uncharacterized protein BDP55DRAFT_31216 [Colletotrichum godetiae]KAK1688813.1 hypothetical protein BDP55DRAFT_31216 [Colletotrichum godetiae]